MNFVYFFVRTYVQYNTIARTNKCRKPTTSLRFVSLEIIPAPTSSSGIYYTTLDLRVDPMGLTPAEVTKRGMDKSYLLEKVAAKVGAEGVLPKHRRLFHSTQDNPMLSKATPGQSR